MAASAPLFSTGFNMPTINPQPKTLRRSSSPLAVFALLAVLALGYNPQALAKDEPTPLAVDASFNASDAASRGFAIADATALKGIKRVAVPVFAVEFITADNVSAQTSSFGSASGGRSSMTSYFKLLGVGEPEFQAMTNALYLNFLADLKASGVEVLAANQVTISPSYSKLIATGSPAPIKNDSSMMLSPPGLGIYGFAKMGGGNSAKGKSIFGALSDMGSGFSAVGAIGDTIQLAAELEASIIEVRMRVSFAQLTNENKGFFGALSNSARTSAKVFPSIDNVMMGVQSGPMRSTVTMKHILNLDGSAFAEVREIAATAGDVAGAVAVGFAHQLGHKVVPLVGPSSILMALMASGFNGQSFTFHGYLPIDKPLKIKSLQNLEQIAKKKNQTQIFMETPFRNNQLLEDILQSLNPETLLCIACNVTDEDEFIKTLPIKEWRKSIPDLHKKPTIFLLL